ncbi:MAG TPA: c-type cytochrome [Solirubrobacteraceae bacterium]|nr:c-type cytochrome [Solirubrobacteraceae bacterium]
MRPATVAAGLLACAAAAMTAAAFATGGEEQRAASSPTPAPDRAAVRDGKAIWVANGCGSCHTFPPAGARGQFGPNLAATLKGMPASYIRESIVAPSKVAAAGFPTGMMPEDYAARIAPAELEQLVEFIRSGVRD